MELKFLYKDNIYSNLPQTVDNGSSLGIEYNSNIYYFWASESRANGVTLYADSKYVYTGDTTSPTICFLSSSGKKCYVAKSVKAMTLIKSVTAIFKYSINWDVSYYSSGNFYAGGGGIADGGTVTLTSAAGKVFYIRPAIWVDGTTSPYYAGGITEVSASQTSIELESCQNGGAFSTSVPTLYWGFQYSTDKSSWTSVIQGKESSTSINSSYSYNTTFNM